MKQSPISSKKHEMAAIGMRGNNIAFSCTCHPNRNADNEHIVTPLKRFFGVGTRASSSIHGVMLIIISAVQTNGVGFGKTEKGLFAPIIPLVIDMSGFRKDNPDMTSILSRVA